MIDNLSELLGLDLSVYNQDFVFVILSMFLFLILSFVYDVLLTVFGYIGGKRR